MAKGFMKRFMSNLVKHPDVVQVAQACMKFCFGSVTGRPAGVSGPETGMHHRRPTAR